MLLTRAYIAEKREPWALLSSGSEVGLQVCGVTKCRILAFFPNLGEYCHHIPTAVAVESKQFCSVFVVPFQDFFDHLALSSLSFRHKNFQDTDGYINPGKLAFQPIFDTFYSIDGSPQMHKVINFVPAQLRQVGCNQFGPPIHPSY